jgi:hypothetical protein
MILTDKERSILTKYRPLLEARPPLVQDFYDNLIMEENLSTIEIGRFIQMFNPEAQAKIIYQLNYFPEGLFAQNELDAITIPSHIETIGPGCFLQCQNLRVVDFERGAVCRHIHYGAFDRCSELVTVVLPLDIVSIAEYSFNGCTNLTKLHFNGPAIKFSTVDLKVDWLGGSNIKKIICTDRELNIK